MIGKKDSFSPEIVADIELERPATINIADGDLFTTLSEITNQAIFICDDYWNILFANSPFCELIKLDKSDVINSSLFEIIFTSDINIKKEFEDLRNRHITGFEIVGTIKTNEGLEVKANLAISSVGSLNLNNNCFLGVIEDITDRCKLEAELLKREKLDTVGYIAGGIIHDFNNNLMGIMGCAEILRGKLKDSTCINYADKMIKMASRASDLNVSMLNFSKKGKIYLKPHNIHPIIDEALSILEPALGPSYSYEFAPNAKKSIIKCDSVFIENAIINLAINARDAMYKGGKIKITTYNTIIEEGEKDPITGLSVPGEYLAIKMSDHGIGIKEELLEKVFDPYFTTKGLKKGTGIGLFIVKKVMNMHGGYVCVNSKEYNGTTFTIFLPLFFGKFEEQSDKKPKTIVKGKGTIMLVDDEDLIREVTEELLMELGYKVVSFGCTADAISYYKEHHKKIDAVLLDMIMPLMTGIEIFEILKFINPNIKAALLTGFSFKEDCDKLIKRGFKTILDKPINKQELSVRVSELLNS